MRIASVVVIGTALSLAALTACGSPDGSAMFDADRDDAGAGPSVSRGVGGGPGAHDCSDPNAGDLEGCSCSQITRACFTVDPSLRNKSGCHDGTQTCIAHGEFAQWGACSGESTSCAPRGTGAGGGSSGSQSNDGAQDAGALSSTSGSNEGDASSSKGSNTFVVGGPCTPGSVQQGPAGSFNCTPTGTASVALYCDSSATWQCFPAGNCAPAACAACLHTSGCDAPLNDASLSASCKNAFQKAYDWLSTCGPDRSSYFAQLQGACVVEVSQLTSCKNTHCVGPTGPDVCSFY